MAQGTIRNLVSDRGFGFIQAKQEQDPREDLFFHRTDVQGNTFDALQAGQAVEYEVGRDERRGKDKAVNVRPVGAA